MSVECPDPPSSWALAFDGPISFVVIVGGFLGNIYSLKQLFSRSINTSMLVSLTGLAIWDIVSQVFLTFPWTLLSQVLLIAALFHHSLWATMHYFSIRDEPWDSEMVAMNALVECGHITSACFDSLTSSNLFFSDMDAYWSHSRTILCSHTAFPTCAKSSKTEEKELCENRWRWRVSSCLVYLTRLQGSFASR